jgi:hypothetical protein
MSKQFEKLARSIRRIGAVKIKCSGGKVWDLSDDFMAGWKCGIKDSREAHAASIGKVLEEIYSNDPFKDQP